jgi:anti-anti-sigma factor
LLAQEGRTLLDDAVVIALHGELDISRESDLDRALAGAEWANRATLDLSRVSFASTTLLNAVLRLRRKMRGHGRAGAIRIVGCAPHVRRIFRLTRLDTLFEVA